MSLAGPPASSPAPPRSDDLVLQRPEPLGVQGHDVAGLQPPVAVQRPELEQAAPVDRPAAEHVAGPQARVAARVRDHLGPGPVRLARVGPCHLAPVDGRGDLEVEAPLGEGQLVDGAQPRPEARGEVLALVGPEPDRHLPGLQVARAPVVEQRERRDLLVGTDDRRDLELEVEHPAALRPAYLLARPDDPGGVGEVEDRRVVPRLGDLAAAQLPARAHVALVGEEVAHGRWVWEGGDERDLLDVGLHPGRHPRRPAGEPIDQRRPRQDAHVAVLAELARPHLIVVAEGHEPHRGRQLSPAVRSCGAPGMILAIDQGTTGTACFVVDDEGRQAGRGYAEFEQYFPRPGWVEHDAEQIWESVRAVARQALDDAGVQGRDLAAVGITNQRETAVAWDRESGEPLHRAIVWQDRRTARRCDELREAGHEPLFRERTGLLLDSYFAGTKYEWLIRNADLGQRAVFGTVDAWLVFKLTGEHATDFSNASRTLLFDIRERR